MEEEERQIKNSGLQNKFPASAEVLSRRFVWTPLIATKRPFGLPFFVVVAVVVLATRLRVSAGVPFVVLPSSPQPQRPYGPRCAFDGRPVYNKQQRLSRETIFAVVVVVFVTFVAVV